MAAKIEKYCAPGVYDTPSYSQAIKVTGAQTILFSRRTGAVRDGWDREASR